MYIDQFGLCWVYSQSTGQLTHVDPDGNVDYTANGGYSGYGQGLNNPAMQSIQAQQHGDPAGPIPQGQYSIRGPYYNPRTGPMTMNLTPINGNNALGRTLLRIHGDNAAHNHTASTGCIVEGANVRNRIANSNDDCLQVVPCGLRECSGNYADPKARWPHRSGIDTSGHEARSGSALACEGRDQLSL